jgi:hypothetical protein
MRAITLRARWAGVRIPVKAKEFLFSSPKRPDRLWDPPGLLRNGYRVSFAGVKRQGDEVNHSPPSRTKVKNKRSYNSAIPRLLNGVNRENFTFCLIMQLSLLSCYSKLAPYTVFSPVPSCQTPDTRSSLRVRDQLPHL